MRSQKRELCFGTKKRPQLLCFYMINVLFSFVYTQHRFSLPLMSEHVFGADGANILVI